MTTTNQLGAMMLTDEQRRDMAKAIVETYLGFPAPDREPGNLDLKAVDAAFAVLLSASKPAAPMDLSADQRQAILHQCRLYLDDESGRYNARAVLTRIFSIAASPAAPAQSAEPVTWALRIGDSPSWAYMQLESDADFYGKQSGLKYEKRPLYAAPQPTQPAKAGEAFAYYTDWADERRYSKEPVEIHEPGLELTFDVDHPATDYWHPLYTKPQQSAPVPDDERAALKPFAYAVDIEMRQMSLGTRRSTTICTKRGGDFTVPLYTGAEIARAASPQAAATPDFLKICQEEMARSSITSLPMKLGFMASRGMTAEQCDEWMRTTRRNFVAAVTATQPAQTRALTVTPAMVKAAMPWLTSLHHMRKTDKESHVEEAIKAALTAAQPASGGGHE